MDPIALFQNWFREELQQTTVKIPTACCLSTTGLDGYPNARFVSMKEVVDGCFIVTGPLRSRKALEIAQSGKAALTFWWTQTERQVRVQGDVTLISEQLADQYFAARNKDSRIVSLVSRQGQELTDMDALMAQYNLLDQEEAGPARPEDWGGFAIRPVRIEFLAFQSTRFHDRQLYEFADGQWAMKRLQP